MSASLAGSAVFNETFSASARFYYTLDSAAAAYQTSASLGEEFALVARFVAPFPGVTLPWSVSPYVKLLQTRFDAPNPFIDDSVTRHDRDYQVGLVVDTPMSERFGLVTNVQFAKGASNLPNYRLNNFSVLTGPTVRF